MVGRMARCRKQRVLTCQRCPVCPFIFCPSPWYTIPKHGKEAGSVELSQNAQLTQLSLIHISEPTRPY